MATAAAGTADCWRRTTLAGALPRTSAAFLFLSVAAVAAVVSARWITATTAVSRKKLSDSFLSFSIGVSTLYCPAVFSLRMIARISPFSSF